MNLIPVQCSHCGAAVEVDAYSKSFVCNICGGSTIIESKTTNDSYREESFERAELLINNQGNYKEAKSKYDYMTSRYPDDPRPWLGLIRCYTHDLKLKLYIDVSPYKPIWLTGFESRIMNAYNNYLRVETKETDKNNNSQIILNYINENKRKFEELKAKNQEETTTLSITANDSESNFNETIKAENKIINSEDILNVIKKMVENLNKLEYIAKKEEEANSQFDFGEKEYSMKNASCKIKFEIDFHDNTTAQIDNADEFYYLYENRLAEIKKLYIYYSISYSIDRKYPEKVEEYINQNIHLFIYEDKFSIDVKISSKDDKISGLYNEIKNIILSAPVKYDNVIKNRMGIQFVCSLAIGLIPALLLFTILYFASESINVLFSESFVLFPLLSLITSIVIGETIAMVILGGLYENIKPKQRYAGYKDGNSVYTDDVEDYVNRSEILIGKNINNMKDRESITDLYNKCKKLVLIELGILVILSIVVVIIPLITE